MENESETETDPVYYEAESFYATPVGNTASDHSKSNNENDTSVCEMSNAMQLIDQIKPPDMSKAISEPIQIYLDCLIGDGGGGQAIGMTESSIDVVNKDDRQPTTSTDVIEPKLSAVGKSQSDNTLGVMELLTTPNSGASDRIKRRHSHLTSEFGAVTQNNRLAAVDQSKCGARDRCDDEISNCDASELLTPVNETNISERYLLESSAHDHAVHDRTELSDAFTELEIDVASDVPDIDVIPQCNARDGQSKSAPTPQTTAPVKTSINRRFSTQNLFTDGKYKGKATHCDGNVFNIFYTISSQELPCGRKVFCVWICRDECDIDDDEDDGKHPNLTLTFNSITSNIETSMDGGGTGAGGTGGAGGTTSATTKRNSMNVNANQSSRPNSVSLLSQYEDEQVSGEYNKYYSNLKQIGKGAFGYVKLAFRHTDRLLVVTKFILKDKLPPQFMVITEDKKEIPMEVYLLSTLKHPNIVTVLDVFENEKFFQLVMEKHGSGMDLFEFIDRRPLMDEQLGKFRFKTLTFNYDFTRHICICVVQVPIFFGKLSTQSIICIR